MVTYPSQSILGLFFRNSTACCPVQTRKACRPLNLVRSRSARSWYVQSQDRQPSRDWAPRIREQHEGPLLPHPPSRGAGVVALGLRRSCHSGPDSRHTLFNLSWFSPADRQCLFAESERVGARAGRARSAIRHLHHVPTAAVAANPPPTGRARTTLS